MQYVFFYIGCNCLVTGLYFQQLYSQQSYCHTSYFSFFDTTTVCGVEILHLKARKFGTKVASRQNSVNYHLRTQITNSVKIMLNWVKHYTMCKIAHSVKNYTENTFFHVPCGKFNTWLKKFTQPATNMWCAPRRHKIRSILNMRQRIANYQWKQ